MRLTAILAALLTVLGAGLAGVRWVRSHAQWQSLREQMQADLEAGSLRSLLRARATGLQLAVAQPGRVDVHVDLAFIAATLAHDHALDLAAEAKAHLEKAGDHEEAAAARALVVAIAGGQPNEAASCGESARCLLALGHARATRGDLGGAAQAYEAAMILEPNLTSARIAYAEGLLGLHQGAGAEAVLRTVEADARASIFKARAGALASSSRTRFEGTVAGLCRQEEKRSPRVASECDLLRVEKALSERRPTEALALPRRAAARLPRNTILSARAAQTLAALGYVDEAASLLAGAPQWALPDVHWAELAVALGRGESAAVPKGLSPTSPETRFLAARAAFAEAGGAGLARWVNGVGGLKRDDADELRRLSRLVDDSSRPAEGEGDGAGTRYARYLAGLDARLRGEQNEAVAQLAGALEGHGDACRALGELVAAARAAGVAVEEPWFETVRRVNRGCINLDGAIREAPPIRKVRPRDTGERRPRTASARPE